MLTPDPRPTSFQNHPGLRDREPEARELADVLRRLIRLSVSAAPPAAETVRLTAGLAALADELETHLPAEPLAAVHAARRGRSAEGRPAGWRHAL